MKLACSVVLLAPAVLLAASGCALHHTESDPDAARYATAWETPRLAQQPVLVDLAVEGDEPAGPMLARAIDALLGSGKFRLATPADEPAFRLKLRVVIRRKTRWFRTAAGGLLAYLLPVDAQSYRVEAIADIETPAGTHIDHCYVQGRGEYTLWLGYALWPEWIWNDDQAEVIQEDALKALTVRICRTLMPGREE
ncbi:MAG: hypothetical protein R6V58_10395 [Planctomycetota bacterium]